MVWLAATASAVKVQSKRTEDDEGIRAHPLNLQTVVEQDTEDDPKEGRRDGQRITYPTENDIKKCPREPQEISPRMSVELKLPDDSVVAASKLPAGLSILTQLLRDARLC